MIEILNRGMQKFFVILKMTKTFVTIHAEKPANNPRFMVVIDGKIPRKFCAVSLAYFTSPLLDLIKAIEIFK